MPCDTTRLHITCFQKITFHENLKILTKSRSCSTTCGGIQHLGWTQMESTLKIIMVAVEIYLFGYDLTIGDLVKRGLSPTCSRTP